MDRFSNPPALLRARDLVVPQPSDLRLSIENNPESGAEMIPRLLESALMYGCKQGRFNLMLASDAKDRKLEVFYPAGGTRFMEPGLARNVFAYVYDTIGGVYKDLPQGAKIGYLNEMARIIDRYELRDVEAYHMHCIGDPCLYSDFVAVRPDRAVQGRTEMSMIERYKDFAVLKSILVPEDGHAYGKNGFLLARALLMSNRFGEEYARHMLDANPEHLREVVRAILKVGALGGLQNDSVQEIEKAKQHVCRSISPLLHNLAGEVASSTNWPEFFELVKYGREVWKKQRRDTSI